MSGYRYTNILLTHPVLKGGGRLHISASTGFTSQYIQDQSPICYWSSGSKVTMDVRMADIMDFCRRTIKWQMVQKLRGNMCQWREFCIFSHKIPPPSPQPYPTLLFLLIDHTYTHPNQLKLASYNFFHSLY